MWESSKLVFNDGPDKSTAVSGSGIKVYMVQLCII